MPTTLSVVCRDCNGLGVCHEPFGGPDDMMPCPCRDYIEMDPLTRAAAELDKTAEACEAIAERLHYQGSKDFATGQANAYRDAAATIRAMRR